jgi:hypothetical protein
VQLGAWGRRREDQDVIKRTTDVVEADIDGERLLLAPSTFAYFGLNDVGARVWDLIGVHGKELDDILDALIAEFDVDRETCRRDVEEFLQAAVQAGTVQSDS